MGGIDLLVRHGYTVVFAWVLAEQIGLPLPAVPFLLAAGALTGSGRLSLGLVLLAATVASLISDAVWYWIGRRGGARVLGWLCRLSLEPDSCVQRTRQRFATYGPRSLLVAKFIPGFNTAAPPLAGVVGMPLGQFLVYTGFGGLIWAGLWVGLGWVFSEQLEAVAEQAAHLGSWLFAVLGAGFGGYVVWKWVARRRFLRRIRIARITPEELKARLDGGDDVLVVDVRDRIDFESEPSIIPGALHMTTEELAERHAEIPREREIVLYCT